MKTQAHARSPNQVTRRTFLKQTSLATLAVAQQKAVLGATQPQRIKVGQIGTGHAHAAGKWQALNTSEAFEVVGIAEPDASRQEQARTLPAFRNARWMSVEDLLTFPDLRMVAVETPVRALLSTARDCLNRGLHIHLDKPAGADLKAFREVTELARQHQCLIQMGYMFRYNPAFQRCFQAVREGWIGQVFSVEAVMSKKSGAGVRRELAEFEGGTMFELGCHLVDSIVHMMGKPEKVTAYNRFSQPGDGLADNQLAVLEFQDAVATLRSTLIEVDGFARRQLVVCGTRGTIEIRPLEPPSMRLVLEEPVGNYAAGAHQITLQNHERYHQDFAALASAIRGSSMLEFSLDHDLAVQETVLRASGMLT